MLDFYIDPGITLENTKAKYNPSDVEIIGIKDAVLNHQLSGYYYTGGGGLDQTTQFYTANDWYTLSADSCRIKLVNNTGDRRYIRGCNIRAKLVYRFSGVKGYIHDAFINYDDILLNGERLFKLQNNMICNVTQINQLADYWWKVHKNKKHIYSITLPGTRHWYKLGLWYTLQIGGAGEAEYIDSTVKLVGKSVEQTPGTLGKTTLTFLEVEENWKSDSSEVARYIASGVPLRGLTGGNVITVASRYYAGTADFYCDGTADQTEIQAAIDWLKDVYNGGTVHLTRGQFNITATIELDSNIVLEGEGAETVIEKNCHDLAIECVGASGTEKENVVIQNLKVIRESADTSNTYLLLAYYVDNFILNRCLIEDGYGGGIYMDFCDSVMISNNLFKNTRSANIVIIHSTGQVLNNYITAPGGVSSFTGISSSYNNNFIISNNVIEKCIVTSGASTLFYGIICDNNSFNDIIINNSINNCSADYARALYIYNTIRSGISGNIIKDIFSWKTLAMESGIYLVTSTTGCKVGNNNCYNNGNFIDYGHCEDVSNPPQTDGNTATNTSAARDNTEAYEGDYSYKITKTNAAGTNASYWFVDNNTTTDMHGTVIKQGSYRLGLWCYVPSTGGPAAAEVNICISEYDGGWNDTTDAMVNQDEWTYIEATVDLDADSTGFRCGVEFASTAAVNEFIYIDNVRLTPMGVANEHDNNFYDGGTDTIIG